MTFDGAGKLLRYWKEKVRDKSLYTFSLLIETKYGSIHIQKNFPAYKKQLTQFQQSLQNNLNNIIAFKGEINSHGEFICTYLYSPKTEIKNIVNVIGSNEKIFSTEYYCKDTYEIEIEKRDKNISYCVPVFYKTMNNEDIRNLKIVNFRGIVSKGNIVLTNLNAA